MKLSPSSSFDLTSNDSVAAAGCISGILRRFVCGNIHDAASKVVQEMATDISQEQKKKLPQPQPLPASPGLVARIMGLESMPALSDSTSSGSSIRRSRSANSTESWNGYLDSGHKNWDTKGRRTSSQSFRETRTFLRAESEDFLILSFGPEDINADASSPLNRVEPMSDCGEPKEAKKSSEKKRRKNRIRIALGTKNKDNNNVLSTPKGGCYRKSAKSMTVNAEGSKKPMMERNMPERSISTKKRSKYAPMEVESECSSQNSSPVSVLDHLIELDAEYISGLASPISGEDNKPKKEKSRKKLSPDLHNHSFPSPKTELIYNKEPSLRPVNVEKNRGNCLGRREQAISDVLKHSCQLAEENIKRSSNWISREMSESDEVAVLLELHILDILIHEAMAEFCFPTSHHENYTMKTFHLSECCKF